MSSVVSRSFFSKKVTRAAIGKLPSTADVLIQTDDSVNMADFRNWATDVTVLLNLNESLESENVGSTSLGTQYFNRFATATLTEAKVIPSKDWLGRNLGSVGGEGDSSQTWIRKDFIDQFRVNVFAINQVPEDSINGFRNVINLNGTAADPGTSNNLIPTPINEIILGDNDPRVYLCTHEPAASGGTGATFTVYLSANLDRIDGVEVPTGTFTVVSATISSSGSGYNFNETLTILGSQFGGVDGVDDIRITNISLAGYNITIPKSDLDTGITISDFIVSSLFQSSSITFIQENDNSDEYYDVFLTSSPNTEIQPGDQILFERGSNSLWSRLNRGSTSSQISSYSGSLERSSIPVNIISATSGDVSYPKFTRSIKVQTTQDLSIYITALKREEFSFYVQIWSATETFENNEKYYWDSNVITGYNKIATKVSPEGVTYYEYYINLKYPLRINITSEYLIQYAVIYKNIAKQLTSGFILESLLNSAISVRFIGTYTSVGFNFPVSKVSTDDAVDQASASQYLQYGQVDTNQLIYLWSNTDVDSTNYPSLTYLNISSLSGEQVVRSYNNNSSTYSTMGWYRYSPSFQTSDNVYQDILDKDRVVGRLYTRFSNSSYQPAAIARNGYDDLSLNNVQDTRTDRGHGGLSESTPYLYVAPFPIGSSNDSRPQLMSNINSGGTTQNIILANLISPVYSISWNERIGTSEPVLTQTQTRYWQREFPREESTGTSLVYNGVTYNYKYYLKIDEEIISYTSYVLDSENRYELIGVTRGELGTTAVAHDGFDSTSVVKPVYLVANFADFQNTSLQADGQIKTNYNIQFYWRLGTYTVDPQYESTDNKCLLGKTSSDKQFPFRYQAPLNGPCAFLNRTYQYTVVSVNYEENSIILNDVTGLGANMSVFSLTGLAASGTGNGAKISKIDVVRKKIFLESTGDIFDPNITDMVGNIGTFRFNNYDQDGAVPYVALFGLNSTPRYNNVTMTQVSQSKVKYYLEPYPIGNRAYEDLYGTVYQAFVSSRNLTTGIPDDDETYFAPRSQSETFLIQASRDQFFSNESIPSNRAKYLYESISDGSTIVLNDSSGIDVGDIVYGPGMPDEGGVIWDIEGYDSSSNLILYPGSAVYNVWFSAPPNYQYGNYIYFYNSQNPNGKNGRDISVGMRITGNNIEPDTYVTSLYVSSSWFYVYTNKSWNQYLSGSITFGSGYYAPARIKTRTKRQVYRDIIIYDYSLASFAGETCARFKLKKTDVGNLQANISHVSQLGNDYLNPAYTTAQSLVLYDGSNYTAPVIGFENHPSETEYYYVYVNNSILEQELTISNYNTFTKGIPSNLEIVNIRKINDLPSSIPVGSEYLVNPIPNLNKNTRYSLDNGKVVWFSSNWNVGDTELNTYYVPDQYDPSVYWDLDKSENARYFHVASSDNKSYSIQETSGTNLIQTILTNSFALPTLAFSINDAVYFTNIPPELSSTINEDTAYYVTSVNSVGTSISVSGTLSGTPISFPSVTDINLKVRKAQALFQEFEGTTSGNELTFSNPASGIAVGAKVYGSGITNPIFRTITDITRNSSGLALVAILDSNVNQPKNQPQIYKITGFNKIKTQDTFNQAPENLDENLVPEFGKVIIGATEYTYNSVSFSNNTFTFTIPVSELNTFYIKPQTKIAVKYPELELETSITASDTKIEILAPGNIPRKFYKLIITDRGLSWYTFTTLAEIKLYYDGVEIPMTGVTVYGPGNSNEFNQTNLNTIIDGNNSTWATDNNFNSNGSTTYVLEFPEPVLVDSYRIAKGNSYYGSAPLRFKFFTSEDGIRYNIVSEESLPTANITQTEIYSFEYTAVDSSYPEFGNILIDDELIYYGYKTKKYFGDCIIKENHSSGSVVSFSPYNAIKENSIIYNGSDELVNVRVVVADTYAPNPTASQQIKVAGLEVDDPYISIALAEKNGSTNQYNENIIISDKIDISKKCYYIDNRTIELEAGAITEELVNGDELLIQTSYGLGPGYKVSLIKDGKSFYLNKPTLNQSVSDSSSTNFRKFYAVDSQILSGLNDALVKAASTFNSGRGFKYIPLSGCLDIKSVKCLESKYISFDTQKYSKTIYLSDTILNSETLTGVDPKYIDGVATNGNYVLSFEGNDYEVESIEYPDLTEEEEVTQSFVQLFQADNTTTYGSSIDVDSSGNMYGLYGSTLNPRSIYLSKITPAGNVSWSRKITSDFSYSLYPENVVVLSDNTVIISFRNDSIKSIGLMKFSSAGTVLLDKELTSGGVENLYKVRKDSSNNIFVHGSTAVSAPLPAGFVSSISPNVGGTDDGYWTLSLPWSFTWANPPSVSVVDSGLSNITTTAGDVQISGTSSFVPAPNTGTRITTNSTSGTVTSITPNILGGSGLLESTTPTYEGAYAPEDDVWWEVDIPFTISYNGVNYTKIFVNSNSYVTFGSKPADAYDSDISWNYTISTPPLPKLQISTADGSAQRVFYGVEGTAPNRTYRFRFEGHNNYFGGVLGSPTMEWELTFYENAPSQFDIQVGVNDRVSVTSTPGAETVYNTVYVGTNSYLTFGGGSNVYWNLSASNPPFNKIMIAAADNSGQRISYGTQGTSPNRTYTIIFEGNNSTSGTLGSPGILWEATFYENDQYRVDIQVAINNRGEGSTSGFPRTGVFTTNAVLASFPNGARVGEGKRIQFSPTAATQVTTISSNLLYSGGGYTGAYIAKLSGSDLSILDEFAYGNANFDARDSVTDSLGNLYVLGRTQNYYTQIMKFSPTKSLLWRKEIGIVSGYNYSKFPGGIELDSSENIIISWYAWSSSNATDPPLKNNYIAIQKYSPLGNIIWSKYYDGLSSDYAHGMSLDTTTDDLYVFGSTSSGPTGSDFLYLKINSSGDLQYQKYIGSSNYETYFYSQRTFSSGVYKNNTIYLAGLSSPGIYNAFFASINLTSSTVGQYGDLFNAGNLSLNYGDLSTGFYTFGNTSPNPLNVTFVTSIQDGNKTSSIPPSSSLTGVKYTYGSEIDILKKYVKVNLTTPLKLPGKYKDTVIVKSPDYRTSYERVPKVRGLVYGPQKAVLFDNYKSLIVDGYGSPVYVYTVNKTLKTSTSHSKIGDLNSYVILSSVSDLHAENVFVSGNGIRPGTKIKSINYKDKVVFLTQSLSSTPSTITFFVRKYRRTVILANGTTDNINIGDTVSFIISGNISLSSLKYYVSSISNSTTLTINGDNFSNPTSNIMYVASADGFSTRDFEIGAIELGGFKNNQRQQIVNTSVIADGTDGAIYDIETVQTRATREMFTKSMGTTLGRFVFKQRNFISKNRPIYWNTLADQPVFDAAKVEKIISGLYLNRPLFVSYSGTKIYWSFNAENWNERNIGKTITWINLIESSENILISFNDGTFKSLSISDLQSGNGIDYTFTGASNIKFIKRAGSYTFIQTDIGLYYTTTNPSSTVVDSIVWNSITLGNDSQILEVVFTDFDYVIIFDEISQTNFYKNFVLSNITGSDLNINTISDRIKGYNNVFTPIKTNAITYGLGKFVEAGYRVLFEGVYQNPFVEIYEYENFSDITSPESTDQFDVKALTFNDGQYICAGLNTNTNTQFIRYSPNARVWIDVDLPDGFIQPDEEISAIEYGGFNIYVAALWNTTTLTNRFIISSLPLPSTTNLTPEQYDVDTGNFRVIETAGNTTLYRYKSSVLDGNLLAWDGSKLIYFRYESGAPVETNELNDFKIIACQSCNYYEYNGLILPDFRTAPEQIGVDDRGDPIFTSAPLSLYEESLTNAVVIYGGEGYKESAIFANASLESNYGISARINFSTDETGQVLQATIADGGRFYGNIEELNTGLRILDNTALDSNGNLNASTQSPDEDYRAIIKFSNRIIDKQFSVYGGQAGTSGYALLYKSYLNSSLYYVMFFDEDGVFLDSEANVFISDIAHLSSEFAFGQGL